MLLFTRVATPKGSPKEVMAFATEMTDYVNRTVETTTTLWSNLFGAPVGTLAFNTLVRSRAQMSQVMMTLMADDEYHERLERTMDMRSEVNPTHDHLLRFVFGDTNESPPEIGAVAEMVSAVAATGRIADVMAWGPEVAQMVSRITGRTPSFWMNQYDEVGRVSWVTLHPDFGSVDAAQDALMNNEEYLTEMVKAGDLFMEGSGQRSAATRVH